MKLIAPILLPLIFTIAVLMGTVSCKKDDTSTPIIPADTVRHITGGPAIVAKLTSRNYRIVEAVLEPGFFGQTNAFMFIDTCLTDDVYKFLSDSTFIQDEGATKCKPGDPQTRFQGTWTVNAAGTRMLVVPEAGTAGTIDYTILDVTATTLKMSYLYPTPLLGSSQTVVETFRVQ